MATSICALLGLLRNVRLQLVPGSANLSPGEIGVEVELAGCIFGGYQRRKWALRADWSYCRAAAMIFSSIGAAYGTAKVCSGTPETVAVVMSS